MKKLDKFLTLCFLLSVGLLYAQNNAIYTSDPVTGIKKFSENGDFISHFIPAGTGGINSTQDIIFIGDEAIVSGLNTTRLKKYTADSGSYLGNFSTYPVSQPTRMKIGADGLLYVLQWGGNSKVLRFDLEGNFVDQFTDIGIPQSIGIDWDSEGNLYVSSFGQGFSGYVQKFDPSGNSLGNFIPSSSPQITGPTNIHFDTEGNLLVLDWSDGAVRKFDPTGLFIENLIPNVFRPEGIAIQDDGSMLIGDGNGKVKRFDSDGIDMGSIISGNGLVVVNAVILRDETTVSIAENELMDLFVVPTIGSAFYLQTTTIDPIQSVEIYDIAGRLVEKKELAYDLIWDANNVPEGLYFIAFRNNKGQRKIQKVVVEK